MSATVKNYNRVLEPELRELCGELDAIQRAKTAEKFIRWADQLTESAMRMEPGIVPLVPPPKVPRGFFLLNLAKWQQDELRELARESGCELRNLIRWAITHVRLEMEARGKAARACGVHDHEVWMFIGGNRNN